MGAQEPDSKAVKFWGQLIVMNDEEYTKLPRLIGGMCIFASRRILSCQIVD